MKVTFLGTGTSQGIPVIACDCEVCKSSDPKDNRLRTSILIEDNGKTFVIDTGPDFRQQMLRASVKRLDAVIFTHEHKDHIAGLDDVRAFNFHQESAMPVYGSEPVLQALRREFHYAFDDFKYPGVPLLDLIEIKNQPFQIHKTTFLPIEVLHYKMQVFGFRIENFTYITDAKTISEKELKKIEGTEILVLNALRKREHISHFTLDEAVSLMNKIKPKKGYLTHISHLLGTHQSINDELPEFIRLAHDGLEITI